MAHIITFINEKGGIGKTSCCFNIAWELANKKKKILLVDMDGQRANLTYFCGVKKSDDMVTIYDLRMKGISASEATKSIKDNLDIIPANVAVSGLNQSAKTKRMKEVLAQVQDQYDYIFIDVSPSPNWGQYLSLVASNYAVIVMLPDMTSLEADNGIIESIEEVQENANPNLSVLGLLFNRNEYRSNMSKQVKQVSEKVAKRLNTKVFSSSIRSSVLMGEVAYAHEGITDYDKKSLVAEDVREIAKELEKEVKKHGKK